MRLRGETTTEAVTTSLTRSEEYGLRFSGRIVTVHTLRVVFENQRFQSMTFYGVFSKDEYSPIEITVYDPAEVPRWAIPWTVYLAWQVSE
jgi:hypothetical protein